MFKDHETFEVELWFLLLCYNVILVKCKGYSLTTVMCLCVKSTRDRLVLANLGCQFGILRKREPHLKSCLYQTGL